MQTREVEFSVLSNTLRGVRWGNGGGTPVIALHGWLDNCASFEFLAPKLERFDIVALDLPGHGRSYHREHVGAYNIWQDIADILLVAEQLNWPVFSLLAHSRGAMIASILAASFPEKIDIVILIESLVPEPSSAHDAPAQLSSSVRNLMASLNRERRYYPSFEKAVAARVNGIIPLGYADARALARRGVMLSGQGYYWANDSKAMAPSEVKFTAEQVRAFLGCLAAPVLVIVGNEGLIKNFAGFAEYVSLVSDIKVVELEGDHFLHMSLQATEIAQYVNSFYRLKGIGVYE